MDDQEERIERLEAELAALKRDRGRVRAVFGYEYKSERQVMGLPLVHIVMGYGSDPEHPVFVARGIIAIGSIAVGVLAFGGIAVGLVALGGLALGALLAFGGVSGGGLAIGGVAFGFIAMGGMAIGHVAFGGLAIGHYAFGGQAIGEHVISRRHWDPQAAEFLKTRMGAAGRWMLEMMRQSRH
jgi:hypothetical protein